MTRPRLDLDGVALVDAASPAASGVVAIFRYRTRDGLVLLVPESADVLVPWEHVEEARVDLASGRLHVRLAASFVARESWVRGARELVGEWTDRVVLEHAPSAPRRP
jgi:hypothetical protein